MNTGALYEPETIQQDEDQSIDDSDAESIATDAAESDAGDTNFTILHSRSIISEDISEQAVSRVFYRVGSSCTKARRAKQLSEGSGTALS